MIIMKDEELEDTRNEDIKPIYAPLSMYRDRSIYDILKDDDLTTTQKLDGIRKIEMDYDELNRIRNGCFDEERYRNSNPRDRL